MKQFRARLRPKPGSVMADGSVIDYRGIPSQRGPCWLPDDYGARIAVVLDRCNALNAAGWRTINPRHPRYIGIPPHRRLICAIRVDQ